MPRSRRAFPRHDDAARRVGCAPERPLAVVRSWPAALVRGRACKLTSRPAASPAKVSCWFGRSPGHRRADQARLSSAGLLLSPADAVAASADRASPSSDRSKDVPSRLTAWAAKAERLLSGAGPGSQVAATSGRSPCARDFGRGWPRRSAFQRPVWTCLWPEPAPRRRSAPPTCALVVARGAPQASSAAGSSSTMPTWARGAFGRQDRPRLEKQGPFCGGRADH